MCPFRERVIMPTEPPSRGETENKQNTKQRAIMPGRGE